MTIDHVGFFIPGAPFFLRMIGRLSAPIFFFLAGESLRHTSNRAKFLIRLYVFSVLMELSKILVSLFDSSSVMVSNNIFSTLFVAMLIAVGIDGFMESADRDDKKKMILFALMVLGPVIWTVAVRDWVFGSLQGLSVWSLKAVAPTLYQVEGGIDWVLLGVAFYFLGKWKLLFGWIYGGYCLILLVYSAATDGIASLIFGNIQWMMVFALPLILLYNGKKGRGCKWLFYIYYPAHIWILYFLGRL